MRTASRRVFSEMEIRPSARRMTRSAKSFEAQTLRGEWVSGTSQQVMSYKVVVSRPERGGFRNY